MRKTIAIVLLVLILNLSACSNGQGSDIKNVDLAQLRDSMVQDLSITDYLDLDSDSLLNLYGIQAKEVAQSACFVTMDGVFPQEVVMIKANEGFENSVESHLQTRLEAFRVQSENYDPESYAIAKKCSILKKGAYVALLLSPDYDALAKMFQDAVGK